MRAGGEMSLESLFAAAVRELRERHVPFAVAGGFASALYRREPRLTMDVDLAIVAASHAKETAVAIVEALGLRAGIVREADLTGGPLFAIKRHNTAPCMIVGRSATKAFEGGVDILLPAIPWAAEAVRRAQVNQVDFGFGRVPVLTIEDVVLSKLYALMTPQPRAKDLDDLQSISQAEHELDTPYLAGQIRRLSIVVPRAAMTFLPEALQQLARDAARHQRKR
jgi:hypothetical protein